MEGKHTLNLSIFLSTIGIFIPIVIQLIYSNFNYININENLVVLRYLFLPCIYFVSSVVIHFKKINSKIIDNLIMLNVLFIGLSIFFFSIADKLDTLNQSLQFFFILPLSTAILFISFLILPGIILAISLFYKSFIKIFCPNNFN